MGRSCHSERWRPRRRPRAWNRGVREYFRFERMFTRFPTHRNAQEGTEDLPCELGVWKKMFLQSCQSVLPDNKVAITEQSHEGVIYALQSRLSLSLDLFRRKAAFKNHYLKSNLDWLTTLFSIFNVASVYAAIQSCKFGSLDLLAGPSVTRLFVGNHRIHRQTKIAFSYSDQGGTLEKIKTTTNAYSPSMKNLTFQKRSKKMLLLQRVVWDQALHWGEKEKKICVDEKKKLIWEVIWGGERMAEPGDMPLMPCRFPAINLSLKCQHVITCL